MRPIFFGILSIVAGVVGIAVLVPWVGFLVYRLELGYGLPGGLAGFSAYFAAGSVFVGSAIAIWFGMVRIVERNSS